MKLFSKIFLAAAMVFSVSNATAQTIKVDGSSTVFPITEAIAEDFQVANRGKIKATVGISGTGGGFKKFCRNEIDISNASRPITAREADDCKKAGVEYIELPVAMDALTVVVNPKNTWAKKMTVDELRRLWEPAAQGKIKTWRQINPAWPDTTVALFGPGADSGTFDYFTEVIVGKAKSSRGDFTASEDDNVLVRGVEGTPGGIGYFGYAYYYENRDKLQAVAVINDRGQAVLPSVDTVMDGSYRPLSRPIYIYVNTRSLQRIEIQNFIKFYMDSARALVTEVKYVPLSDRQYKENWERAKKLVR